MWGENACDGVENENMLPSADEEAPMGRVGVVLRCLVRLLGIEGEWRLRCAALVGSLVGSLAAKSPCVTLSKQVVSISFRSCLIISSM